MKLIVISNPSDLDEEIETIHSLFENGLECFHLRKPEKNEEEFELFLKKINPLYFKRIVIHSSYQLISKYNLKGIHLREEMIGDEKLKDLQKTVTKRNLSISASIHTLEKISLMKGYEYVFLSPVFDSFSKLGYGSKIDLTEFISFRSNRKFPTKVIGLGGVSKSNIDLLVKAGFDGGALLGAIWQQEGITQRVNEFVEVKSKMVG